MALKEIGTYNTKCYNMPHKTFKTMDIAAELFSSNGNLFQTDVMMRLENASFRITPGKDHHSSEHACAEDQIEYSVQCGEDDRCVTVEPANFAE